MNVLIAHYSDDWQMGSEETKVFADTEEGLTKAIDWVESNIPWIEEHMKMYFKGCSKTIGTESRIILAKRIKREGSVSDWNCKEKFPAKFEFSIRQMEIEE